MISEELVRAQSAIEERLRANDGPMKAGDLFKHIQDAGLRDIDLREAVWLLIGKGKVQLNWDRQLVLADELDPKATEG